MYKISKDFSFCYGHRVWTQKLNEDYCEGGDASCKCKHLHGHEALVTVYLQAKQLSNGFVTDFKHLGWLKDFLNEHLDHKFILDKNDPLMWSMTHACVTDRNQIFEYRYNPHYVEDILVGWTIDLEHEDLTDAQKEYVGSFFIVDFVPTSENLAKWLYEIVETRMNKLGVDTEKVTWNETPKSQATYEGI